MTKCKKCNQEICFIKMKETGKSMPVTLRLFDNKEAAEEFFNGKGKIRFLVTNAGEVTYTGAGYVPHWFNCTDPDHFSKGKKNDK